MDQYLQKELTEERYLTKRKPCDFLEPNGSCKLGGTQAEKLCGLSIHEQNPHIKATKTA